MKSPSQIEQTHAAWLSPLRKAVEGWIVESQHRDALEEVFMLELALLRLGHGEVTHVEDCHREFG